MQNAQLQLFTGTLLFVTLCILGLSIDIRLLRRLRRRSCRAVFVRRRLYPPLNGPETGRLLLQLALLIAIFWTWNSTVLTLEWISGSGYEDSILELQSGAIQFAGLVFVLLAVRSKRDWRMRRAWRRPSVIMVHARQATLFCVGMMPLFWIASTLSWLLLVHTPYEFQPQKIVRLLQEAQTPRLLDLLIVGIAVSVAPVWEETLFRGILMPLFDRHLGRSAAIVLSSARFALIHVHLPSLLPLFVIACAFALAYIYSGSILVPVLMHALFNAIQLLLVALA